MPTSETALLGGGCFWCLDAVFRELRGVLRVDSGFAGGTVPSPSYEDVCEGDTGHAEVVRITYDPAVITFGDLLDVFFTTHDPTTPNRQGGDVGLQYRSVIFYADAEQQRIAAETIARFEAKKVWRSPIVTQVVPAATFYAAEEHHQDYYAAHPAQPYCQIVIAPKVAKLRRTFMHKLRS